jgi:hypothetical protein
VVLRGTGRTDSIPNRRKVSPFSTEAILAEALPPECEADYLPPSSAEVNIDGAVFSLLYAFYGAVLKHGEKFTALCMRIRIQS